MLRGDHGVVCEALLLAKADPLKKAGSQPAAMELLAVNDGDSEAREVAILEIFVQSTLGRSVPKADENAGEQELFNPSVLRLLVG
eukprot:78932-Amphidinium_carterae.3